MNSLILRQRIAAVVLLTAPTIVSAQLTTTVTNFASGTSVTNQFNTNSGYERTFSIEEQPNYPTGAWATTDPYNPVTEAGSTSLVAFINNWTPLLSGSGNNSVYFGGYNADSGTLPGIADPSIYYSFNSSVAGINDLVSYTVDFGIIGPSVDYSLTYTNKDLFGFSLRDASGASMAAFTFNPFAATSTNGLRVQWEQNGTNVIADGVTFKNFDIQYGGLYRLTATAQGGSLDLSIAGLNTQNGGPGVGITNYAVVTNASIITGGALSTGFTAADFERASIDWELTSDDPSLPGANYMIINASSVISTLEVIPEPGTWVAAGLLLLLAGGVAARRRRAESA
jgi:hypothetical protein